MAKSVLTPQAEDFPRWYQDVIAKAELAENGPVRGTMVIRPWCYAIWEHLRDALDRRIKAAGAENAYFPMLDPRVVPAPRGRARGGVQPRARGGDARRRQGAGRAGPGAAHERDDHQPLLRQVDLQLPRPAAEGQQLVQHRALGAAPADVPAHDRVSLA